MLAPLVAALAGWQRIGDNPRLVGEIGLVIAAAALVGIMTARWLSPGRWARELGMLAAFAFTALLAFAGYGPAATILYAMAAVLFLWLVLSILSSLDWG